MTSWTLRARAANLAGGAVINDWTSLVLVQRWNLPDTLSITGQWADLQALYQDGSGNDVLTGGCTLNDDTGRRFSGLLSIVEEDIDADTVTLTFESDLIRLWERNVYPDPAHAWGSQTTDYDVRTGAHETSLLAYINLNAGPGALVARRIAGLAVPTSLGRGSTTPITARFDVLGRLVSDYAIADGLTFDVLQSGSALNVTVTAAPDLSATARYGTSHSGGPGLLGDGARVTLTKPDVTTALVAGGGIGVSRVLRERTDTAAESAWGRRSEQLVDQNGTSNTTELDKAGDDALAAGAQPVAVEAPINDAPDLRLGTDVPLGSLVTLDLRRRVIVDRLQQITTAISASDGPTVQVSGLVGSPDAGLTRSQKEFLAMKRQLRKVAST